VRPSDVISSELRDRLDAARDYLDITIEWHERGSPHCHGRDFGFRRIMAGPAGWPQRPKREYRYGDRRDEVEDGPCIVEWDRLDRVIERALDHAERRWPAESMSPAL
jgi:hypothetical protein